MTNADSTQEMKHQYRRARRDLLHLLDWFESELGRIEEKPQDFEPFTDRHHWILDQLRDGVKVTRKSVQEEFGIGGRQAKRVLAALTSRKLIYFVRRPKPGHYALWTKVGRAESPTAVEPNGDAALGAGGMPNCS